MPNDRLPFVYQLLSTTSLVVSDYLEHEPFTAIEKEHAWEVFPPKFVGDRWPYQSMQHELDSALFSSLKAYFMAYRLFFLINLSWSC